MNASATTPAVRPTTDRFLIGLLLGIIGLLVIAGITVIVLRQPVQQIPAGTPSATIQQFYNALAQRDYDRAYMLFSDTMYNKPTREEFINYTANRFGPNTPTSRAQIDHESINGNSATVTVKVTYFYSSPMGGTNEYSNIEAFGLQRDSDTWRITDLPPSYRPYPY